MTTSVQFLEDIHAIDPAVEVWIAIGAFAEEPLFIAPKAEWLQGRH